MYNFFIMTSSFSVNIVFKIDNKDCGDVGKKRAQKYLKTNERLTLLERKVLGVFIFLT